MKKQKKLEHHHFFFGGVAFFLLYGAARGFVVFMVIRALAGTLAIRAALRVDPANAIGG